MLENYGIYPSQLEDTLRKNNNSVSGFISSLLLTPTGLNNFTLALIKEIGESKFIDDLSELLKIKKDKIENEYEKFLLTNKHEVILTGAEAVSILIHKANVKYVFAYPGTSELALCNSISITPDIELINGRGDKESAFMAAGGSAMNPGIGAAVLHGARGLTNATGGIADAFRNEIGAIYLVGLPSTSSSPFLPPHGERNLIKSIGNFVKFYTEITESAKPTDSQREKNRKIKDFLERVNKTLENARTLPIGPTMIGLPQDIMEERWIPYEVLKIEKNTNHEDSIPISKIKSTVNILNDKKKPVILIDDFIFKTPGSKESLLSFAKKVQAPILQIRYLRGPMLFERLSSVQNPYFAGSYDNNNPFHQELIKKADVIITVEDRNGYPRVIGNLPDCQKIAITSNPNMTKKNKYLKDGDLILAGNTSEILNLLAENINIVKASSGQILKYCKKLRSESTIKIQTKPKYKFMRNDIAEIFSDIFNMSKNPVIVDDSQMFGGLMFESYDKFPEKIRVFGDHGGFIGGGMAMSAGLALGQKSQSKVFCFIGDQSFTNGLQSLVSVVQEEIPIIYIVCNNGKSVSLLKQAKSDNDLAFNKGVDRFLQNPPSMNYSKISKEMGLNTYKIEFDPENKKKRNPGAKFKKILKKEIKSKKPTLIELILPSTPEAWEGIWAIKGNETSKLQQ